jgi:outer membrane protein assembly factor BamB
LKNKQFVKICLLSLITILIIISTITSIAMENKSEDDKLKGLLNKIRYICTDVRGFNEIKYKYYKEQLLKQFSDKFLNNYEAIEQIEALAHNKQATTPMINGLMDSPWPMKCHDTHHTSQSPYSTVNNSYDEKWRFKRANWVQGGSVIGDDDTIYFGCFDNYLYAIFPNMTIKWKYKTGMWIWSAPAIADDGTIYVSSYDDYLHAVNPDGTRKWVFPADDITSSPAIGDDGSIYFGVMGPGTKGRIYAVYSNGTERWHYDTGYWITSDPAIGDDGTIYIGSGDTYLYAINPNGILKWRFKTGDYVKGPPSIANDGTVYIGSYDGYLYALYPNNGSMKWRCGIDEGTETNPSIDNDGVIYVGGNYLYAIYPNGTLKWKFNFPVGGFIHKSSPAISVDGTIYFGTDDTGYVFAVNPDGTEKWSKNIANEWVESSPCIAEDGTIFIGSSSCDAGYDYGYLHAFGTIENNKPPHAPSISGPTYGNIGESYTYTFVANDPEGLPVRFYIEWGDNTSTGWTKEYKSGEKARISHSWSEQNTYTIKAKAKDPYNAEGPEGTLDVTMPKNKQPYYPLLQRLIEQFPILQRLFLLIK